MKSKLENIVNVLENEGILVTDTSVRIHSLDFIVIGPEEDPSEATATTVMDKLEIFYNLSLKLNIPTNNAVAFYSAINKRKDELISKHLEELKCLLHYAIAGRGFLFGTSYAADGHSFIRPCDCVRLNLCEEKLRQICKSCLLQLASSRQAPYFWDDYAWLQNHVFKALANGKRAFVNSGASSQTKSIDHTTLRSQTYQSFWNIYQEYCIMQYEKGEIPEREEAEKQLEALRRAGTVVITLDRYWNALQHIQRKSKQGRLKKWWLHSFRKYLRVLDNELKSCYQFELDKYPELYSLISTSKKSLSPSKSTLRNSPLWDEESKSLSISDRRALMCYRRHPIYRFIIGIARALSDTSTWGAEPYYLTYFLTHKKKPGRPFTRSRFKIEVKYTKFQPKACSNDARSVRVQFSHRWLFGALCEWWDATFPEYSADGDLNQYLFQRCYRHVLDWEDGAKNLEPAYQRIFAEDPMYIIQSRIAGALTFDYSMFPQYAKTMILRKDSPNSVPQDKASKSREWAVRRKLDKLITDKRADEFKKIALDDPAGIGMSFSPKSWHISLARWLEEIIRSDNDVAIYVEGNQDIRYPDSELTVEQVAQGIDFYPGREVYPENYQNYLASVELTIQELCCQRIAQQVVGEAVQLYRQVFLSL